MTNWNKTGKIKAFILLVLFTGNMIASFNFPTQPLSWTFFVFPFPFGLLSVYLQIRTNRSYKGSKSFKPGWNDNPFSKEHPLAFTHTFAILCSTIGVALLIGPMIRYGTIHPMGITAFFWGTGMLAGIRVGVKEHIEAKK